jgi:hypothetical protein
MYQLAAAIVIASALSETAPRQRTLRIVANVRPVCDPEQTGPARLVVHVLDHEGRPLEGIHVTAGRSHARPGSHTAKTDPQGVARFDFPRNGDDEIAVAAAFRGFFTSVAHRVHIRGGCLAGITLPMQIEVPKDHLTIGDGGIEGRPAAEGSK